MASKHQFGRPVKMLQTSWPLIGFHKADAVKPQIPKPRPKLWVPGPGGQGQRHPPRLMLSRPR